MQPASRDDKNLRMGVIGAAVVGVWLVVVAYATHSAMPYNVVRLPQEGAVQPLMWMPQGWSFFTRDAREARLTVLRQTSSGWISALRSPHAQPSNLFGFNRTSRAEGTESAQFVTMLPVSAWSACDSTVVSCLATYTSSVQLKSPVPVPLLCGKLALVSQAPVPWAWLSLGSRVQMPSKVARVDIQC
jgi:antimicrobial peptide system SdpA family protein